MKITTFARGSVQVTRLRECILTRTCKATPTENIVSRVHWAQK